MILLPTRRRLINRRDELYSKLNNVIECGSVQHLEQIMRQIHCINLKLRTYFIRKHEPKEVFDDDYDNIKAQNPFTFQDPV